MSIETYLDKPNIVRLNGILDHLTAKPFLNQQVFVDAVRAALDFHGYKLPHLPCEQEIHGPSYPRSYGDIAHGPGFEDNRNTPGIPIEFTYVFKVKYEIESEAGAPLFLYMTCDRVDNDGDKDGKLMYWEAYAQIVDENELKELTDMDDPHEFEDHSNLTGEMELDPE